MYSVTGTAIRRADTARHRENRCVLALVELCFLRWMAASAKRGDFLRARDFVRRGSSGRLPVLHAGTVAGIAA
jgi:hypothetical protein